jgi:hypothetical protein
MNDIILEREGKGLCPLCGKKIDAEFKVATYKGKKVWVCKGHPVAE